MSSVVVFDEGLELPSGTAFVDETGVWTIQIATQKLIYTGDEITEIDISELMLSESDQICSIKYIQRDSVVFIYAKRDNIPTGFFISLKTDKKSYEPRVLSFSVETLLFHNRIYDCISPIEGAICVISQEGITLHRKDLKPTFSIMTSISSYCHDKNYVMIYAKEKRTVTIYRFSETLQTTVVFSQEYWPFPIPNAMIALSHCVLLITSNSGATVVFHVVPLTPKPQMMTYQRTFDLPDPVFFTYDDILYIQSCATNEACLVDIMGDQGLKLGEAFTGVPGIIGITNKHFIGTDKRYGMKVRYEEIARHNPKVIASLLRRKNGASAAIKFLLCEIKAIDNTADMISIMNTIGPYATACDVQMRVVNALQFGVGSDPHMAMIGMITLLKALGKTATPSTKVSMLKVMTHPLCVHGISNLLLVNNLKLDLALLRILIGGAGLAVELSEKNLDDPLDYAQVCIEYGFKEAAKRMLIKQSLNSNTNKERIRSLQEQL